MFFIPKLIGKMISSVFSLLLLFGLATTGFVYFNANQDERTKTDVIVVLGAAQFNGEPSPVFANRLDHALELILLDVAPVIVTVGGKQPGDRFTEASAGRNYLIDSGLNPNQIIAIPTGSDTLESLTAVSVLLNKKKWHNVTLVSDPAHMARTQAIATHFGFAAFTSPTSGGPGSEMDLDYLVRETGGLLHFWVLDQWSAQS